MNEVRCWHAPTLVWTQNRDERCSHCGRWAPDSASLCLRCSRLFCGTACVEATNCNEVQPELFGMGSKGKDGAK